MVLPEGPRSLQEGLCPTTTSRSTRCSRRPFSRAVASATTSGSLMVLPEEMPLQVVVARATSTMTTRMTCTARPFAPAHPVHIYVLHKRRCIVCHVIHEYTILPNTCNYTRLCVCHNAESIVPKDQLGMKIQF